MDSLDELRLLLAHPARGRVARVLLDNFAPDAVAAAVALRAQRGRRAGLRDLRRPARRRTLPIRATQASRPRAWAASRTARARWTWRSRSSARRRTRQRERGRSAAARGRAPARAGGALARGPARRPRPAALRLRRPGQCHGPRPRARRSRCGGRHLRASPSTSGPGAAARGAPGRTAPATRCCSPSSCAPPGRRRAAACSRWARAWPSPARRTRLGAALALKWPNDVLLVGAAGGPAAGAAPAERKVAGVLSEARLSGGRLPAPRAWDGHQRAPGSGGDFPPALAGRAASLDEAAGRRLARGELLAALLVELEAVLGVLAAGDPARDGELLDAWRGRWPHRGRWARDGGRAATAPPRRCGERRPARGGAARPGVPRGRRTDAGAGRLRSLASAPQHPLPWGRLARKERRVRRPALPGPGQQPPQGPALAGRPRERALRRRRGGDGRRLGGRPHRPARGRGGPRRPGQRAARRGRPLAAWLADRGARAGSSPATYPCPFPPPYATGAPWAPTASATRPRPGPSTWRPPCSSTPARRSPSMSSIPRAATWAAPSYPGRSWPLPPWPRARPSCPASGPSGRGSPGVGTRRRPWRPARFGALWPPSRAWWRGGAGTGPGRPRC